MKKIVIILFSVLLTTSITIADTNIPGGNVSGIWTFAGSPYIIDGEITIPSDSTLSIEPGVIVQFSGHYKFIVYGRLIAEGNADSLITFTAQDTTTGWHGLRFHDTNINGQEASSLAYCTLEYGRATGAESSGGAVYLENANETFENVMIMKNYAAGYGGGIYMRNSNPNLTDVSIHDNTATYGGGGIYCYTSNPELTKVCIYNNNTSWYGGGIACFDNSNPTLINATISKNIANYGGSGIACLFSSDVTLLNSIVWDNGINGIYFDGGGTLTATYSDIENGTGQSYTDTTCVDSAPLFADPLNGDFHLTWANIPTPDSTKSPCIDTGHPDPIYNDPDNTRNDMGAFYFVQTGIRGVVTLDGGYGNVQDVEVTAILTTPPNTETTVNPDEDGNYFLDISSGTYDVTASLTGYNPSSYYSVNVANQIVILDFTLSPPPPGMIKGTVDINEGTGNILETEVSAGGITVHPYGVEDPYNPGVILYYEYEIEIAPGTYNVSAYLAGYRDSTITNVVVQSGLITENINFILQLIRYEGYIEGTVTLYDGTGNVADVEVTADTVTVHPDVNGDYQIEILSGTYDVIASLDHYTGVTISDVEVVAEDTTRNIDMTLLNWDVIQGTQFVMTVYATVTYDGKFVEHIGSNQVAAFGPGGDCRGVAVWQTGNHPLWSNYWDLNGYWYFTIVSDDNSGEDISFKMYETETDSIYDCVETITFEDCTDNAINLNAPSPTRNQNFGLIEHWNWISFNLHPPDPSISIIFDTLTPNDIYQVKEQYNSTTYTPGVGWGPGLTEITDGEGYLVYMNNAVDTFTVSGTAINPIINPINLLPNWNWVGYYPYVSLTLSEALASISATVVKTQDKSAIYSGGWVGDLIQLEPGVTYKINVPDSSVLIYPLIENDKSEPLYKKNNDYNQAGWQLITGTQYNMIAMADIKIDNETIGNFDNYIVGVFDNEGNCRSVGKKVYDFWYFTIVGNVNGEELYFKVYDMVTEETFKSNEEIIFQNDAIVGSPEKAVIVTCNGSNSDIPEEYNLYNSHPNPFYNSTSIKYQIPERTKVNISIYNILGQKVKTLVNSTKEPDTYIVKWDGKDAENNSLPSGIYFYKLTTGKYTKIQKLIKLK